MPRAPAVRMVGYSRRGSEGATSAPVFVPKRLHPLSAPSSFLLLSAASLRLTPPLLPASRFSPSATLGGVGLVLDEPPRLVAAAEAAVAPAAAAAVPAVVKSTTLYFSPSCCCRCCCGWCCCAFRRLCCSWCCCCRCCCRGCCFPSQWSLQPSSF